MRLLLDTHALLWWQLDDAALTRTTSARSMARRALAGSSGSIWEVAIKQRLGKLPALAIAVAELPGLAADLA